MKYIIIIALLFSQFSYGSCPESVQLLQAGQLANCTGYLYSPGADEAANVAYERMLELEEIYPLMEKKVEIKEQRNIILEKRLDLYIKQSDMLAKQLVKKENRSEWQKVLYFGLGVVATGMVYIAAKRF